MLLTFILTVVLVMPGDVKDIVQKREMASAAECYSAAEAWVEQDVHNTGGVGLVAACQLTSLFKDGEPS